MPKKLGARSKSKSKSETKSKTSSTPKVKSGMNAVGSEASKHDLTTLEGWENLFADISELTDYQGDTSIERDAAKAFLDNLLFQTCGGLVSGDIYQVFLVWDAKQRLTNTTADVSDISLHDTIEHAKSTTHVKQKRRCIRKLSRS